MDKVLRIIKHPISSRFLSHWLRKNPVLGFYSPGHSEKTPHHLRWLYIFKIAIKVSERSPEYLFSWAGNVLGNKASRLPRFSFFSEEEEEKIPGSNRMYAADGGGFVARLKKTLATVTVDHILYDYESPLSYDYESELSDVESFNSGLLSHYDDLKKLINVIIRERGYDENDFLSTLNKCYQKGTISLPPTPFNHLLKKAMFNIGHEFKTIGDIKIRSVGCRRYVTQFIEDCNINYNSEYKDEESCLYEGIGYDEDGKTVPIREADYGVAKASFFSHPLVFVKLR